MATVQDLYKLQRKDLEIDAVDARIAAIEQQLLESEQLVRLREETHAAKEALHKAQHKQRDLEASVAELDGRIAKESDTLYGGSVKKAKELQAHQKQVENLRESKRKLESQVIGVMSDLEDLQNDFSGKNSRLEQAEQDWQEQSAGLRVQLEEQHAKRRELQAQRDSLAALIDKPSLTIYTRLRAEKRGRAVAQVQRNVCEGCRITLPVVEVNRIRANRSAFHYCSSCGRMLLLA